MTYRRIAEDSDQTVGEADSRALGDLTSGASLSCAVSSWDDSVDEGMHHYTRVQILAQLSHFPEDFFEIWASTRCATSILKQQLTH